MSRAWSVSAEVSAALVVKKTRAPSRETPTSVAPLAPPVPRHERGLVAAALVDVVARAGAEKQPTSEVVERERLGRG
jgi:hypothetical protein